MTCIYAIFNVANGKRYIGQSVNHKNRWKNHIHELDNGNHHNDYLPKLELKLKEMIE